MHRTYYRSMAFVLKVTKTAFNFLALEVLGSCLNNTPFYHNSTSNLLNVLLHVFFLTRIVYYVNLGG